MTTAEYLEEILRASDTYDITDSAGNVIDTISTITSQNVVVTDLITGTLVKQLRDMGIAGRELADYVSLDDIDGPAKQIIDTMLTALFQTKKSRFVASDYFRSFGAGRTRAQVNDAVNQAVKC